MFRRRERNDVQEMAVLSAKKIAATKDASPSHLSGPSRDDAACYGPHTKGCHHLSLKLNNPSFSATISANLIKWQVARDYPSRVTDERLA
jgi:uncharacterized protein (DUF736 family)